MNEDTKRVLRRVRRALFRSGLPSRDLVRAWWRFWVAYARYRKLAPSDRRPSFRHLYPCLGDDSPETPVEPVYFYQDAWAFEKVFRNKPSLHVDVGSHYKFVSLLSKVVPVVMVDIRPLRLPLDSLQFKKGSITDLPFADSELRSVSSLCVIEHIGLGRYGDTIDPYGAEKAIEELKRVLMPGGRLYISVPVGDENVTAFNAGRVFSLDYLKNLLLPLIVLEERFIVGNSLQEKYESRAMFGTTGLFELTKL